LPLSFFQNPVGFGKSSWKKRSVRFFLISKVAVPKTEVLEQPPLIKTAPYPAVFQPEDAYFLTRNLEISKLRGFCRF
jgi:hypothetical protein